MHLWIINRTKIRGEGVIFIAKRPLDYKILHKRETRRRFGSNQHPLFKSKKTENNRFFYAHLERHLKAQCFLSV